MIYLNFLSIRSRILNCRLYLQWISISTTSQLPQAYSFLKYSPVVYRYMVVKLGLNLRFLLILMREILTVRIGIAQTRYHASNTISTLDIRLNQSPLAGINCHL